MGFYRNAIRFCLQFANISIQDVSYVVFPGITYNDITRILETYFKFHFGFCPNVKIVDHHMAHAASVFYTYGFDDIVFYTYHLNLWNKYDPYTFLFFTQVSTIDK